MIAGLAVYLSYGRYGCAGVFTARRRCRSSTFGGSSSSSSSRALMLNATVTDLYSEPPGIRASHLSLLLPSDQQ